MPMQAPDVSFTKFVDIFERAHVDKDFNVDVWVKGTSAMANATADALGKNTHSETTTITHAVEGIGSSSASESVSLATKNFDFHHNW
jgi:hypothetical protein